MAKRKVKAKKIVKQILSKSAMEAIKATLLSDDSHRPMKKIFPRASGPGGDINIKIGVRPRKERIGRGVKISTNRLLIVMEECRNTLQALERTRQVFHLKPKDSRFISLRWLLPKPSVVSTTVIKVKKLTFKLDKLS